MPTKKSVLQTVLAILGTSPDDAIKSEAWIELFKLQLALKGLASAIDSLREKSVVVSKGQDVTYQTIGDVEYSMYLQDMTKVTVPAYEYIRRNSAVFFASINGVLKAFPTFDTIEAQGYSVNSVAKDAVGEFILKGFVSYNYDFTNTKYNMSGLDNGSPYPYTGHASHHRISTYPELIDQWTRATGTYDPYRVFPKGGLAWYTSYDWWSNYIPKQRGPHRQYAGLAVGNAAATIYGATYLMYFNPERW